MLRLDVLVQVAVANEGEIALITLEGSLPRVGVLVVLEIVHCVEPLVARVALVRLQILKKL